jgi:CheY-like chemotaxis protein
VPISERTDRDGAAGSVLVLVVDDNVAFAENVAEILELDGYATAVAASAEEALPRALAGDVRVLVTDYRLPGLTGAELVALVRRQRGNVRAVVMSAFTDPGTVRAVRESDAHGFLPKPIDFSLLGRLIRGREGTA